MNKIPTPVIYLGVAIVGLYIAKEVVKNSADAITTFNDGTPFEGAGVVGTVGNITNKASGGILARIGSSIGGALADARERILGIGV